MTPDALKAPATLFVPANVIRWQFAPGSFPYSRDVRKFYGTNPPPGGFIDYMLTAPAKDVSVKVLDVNGKAAREFRTPGATVGFHRLQWSPPKAGAYRVASIEAKPIRRNPSPPFTTSTLQQEASRQLGFAPARTMQVAQRLYEDGLITYMRTDGVQSAPEAISATRRLIASRYGDRYLPEAPRGRAFSRISRAGKSVAGAAGMV
jgi:DNA topoisomerase IA